MKTIRFSTTVGNWRAGDEMAFPDDLVDRLVAERKGVEINTKPVVKDKVLRTLSDVVEEQAKLAQDADRAAMSTTLADKNPNVPAVKNKAKHMAGSN